MSADLVQTLRLYCPTEHLEQFWHTDAMVIPTPVEYVPAWQVRHDAEALTLVPLEYVPGRQAVQDVIVVAARPVEYKPETHEVH